MGELVEYREAEASHPLDADPVAFSVTLARRGENRMNLMRWVRGNLVEGTDFGKIHVMKRDRCDKGSRCDNPYHFSKPTLWKPGAEKIAGLLGVLVSFPNLPEYERAAYSGVALQHIVLRCHLVSMAGQILADGVGACSVGNDLNKALKMAAKSAHVDATLRLAGLSEVFTAEPEAPAEADSTPARTQQEPARAEREPGRPKARVGLASAADVALIRRRMDLAGIEERAFFRRFPQAESFDTIPSAEVETVLEWIRAQT